MAGQLPHGLRTNGSGSVLRAQDNWIRENQIRFELRLSAAEGPQASAQASVRLRRNDETFLRLKSGSDFKCYGLLTTPG